MDFRFYPNGTVKKITTSCPAKDLPLGTVEYVKSSGTFWITAQNTLGGSTPWWKPLENDNPIRTEIKAKLLLLKD